MTRIIFNRLIHKPRSIAARGWIFQVHLWVGILVALYAIVIGISGSAVVFRPELRVAISGSVRITGSGPRVPADRALESVRAAYPGASVTALFLPQKADDPFRVAIRSDGRNRQLYVNPFTAQIIGEQPPQNDWLRWLQNLHFDLLGGRTGRFVNGVFGLLAILLALTGMMIWWPGAAHWTRAIRIKWNARWPRVNYDLHGAVGIYSLLFILLLSLTGVYYAWPFQSRALISRVSAVRYLDPAPPLAPRASGGDVPVSRLIEIGATLVPADANVLRVTFAFLGSQERPIAQPESGRAVQVIYSRKGEYDDPYLSSVFFDPQSAAVLRVDRADRFTVGESIVSWIPTLHFGTFGWIFGAAGPVPVKIVWVLFGLTPSVLGVTGLLMWWNRVAKKSVRRWRAAPVAALALRPDQADAAAPR